MTIHRLGGTGLDDLYRTEANGTVTRVYLFTDDKGQLSTFTDAQLQDMAHQGLGVGKYDPATGYGVYQPDSPPTDVDEDALASL